MGLDVPQLDDRTYDELLEQAKKLIPAYSDEWTDFNPHDPGITILEVLAWLTETHIYQLDQITDEHREKYLRLMGHDRRGPTPASTSLRLQPPTAAAGRRLPAGTKLAVTDGTDDTYQFETDHDVVLTAASIERVVTVDDAGETDNTEANRTDGMFYRVFGDTVERGDTIYLGFDRDPLETSRSLTLMVDYHDDDLPDPMPTMSDDRSFTFTPSVDLVWEYRVPEDGTWRHLTVETDETNVLYEGGSIELRLPDDERPSPRREEPIENARPWRESERKRNRDSERGTESEREHVWLRCRVETSGYEIPPQVNAISTNTVSASHRASVRDEQLRPSSASDPIQPSDEPTALDGQSYEFANESILSATVYVDGERFQEVPDFDASGPNDPHYVLDRERGRVTFGDGHTGRVPPADATVTADYVHGGGEEGNVSANAVWRFTDSSERERERGRGREGEGEREREDERNDENDGASTVSLSDIGVEPTKAATGGTDRETIEDALRRARRDLRRPYRAVTEDDYRYLASRTPGLRIGRTNVLADGDRITVVFVPYAPPDVSRPAPSDGFVDAVRRHLRERAILTDRVHVTGPRYVELEITVTGRTRPRYTDSGHETAVADAIESYVHPLYGYDGEGWPFGRTLVATDLAETITDLDPIDRVTDVSITAHGGTTIDEGTVKIDDTALFCVEDVTVNLTTNNTGTGGGM